MDKNADLFLGTKGALLPQWWASKLKKLLRKVKKLQKGKKLQLDLKKAALVHCACSGSGA